MTVRLLITISVLLCCTAASSSRAVSDVVNTDFEGGLMIDPYGKMNPGLWAVVSELSIDDMKLSIENNMKLAIDSNDSYYLRKELSKHFLWINAISQKDGEGRYILGNVLKASLGDDFVRFIACLTSHYLVKINTSRGRISFFSRNSLCDDFTVSLGKIRFYRAQAESPLELNDIVLKSPDGDFSVEKALVYLFCEHGSRYELKFDAEFMLEPKEVLIMSFLHDILDDLTLHQFFKELSYNINFPGAETEDLKMMGFSKDRGGSVPFDNDKYLEGLHSSMVKSLGTSGGNVSDVKKRNIKQMAFDDQNRHDDSSDGAVADQSDELSRIFV